MAWDYVPQKTININPYSGGTVVPGYWLDSATGQKVPDIATKSGGSAWQPLITTYKPAPTPPGAQKEIDALMAEINANPSYKEALGGTFSAFTQGTDGVLTPDALRRGMQWVREGKQTSAGEGVFEGILSGAKDIAGVLGPMAAAAAGFQALPGLTGIPFTGASTGAALGSGALGTGGGVAPALSGLDFTGANAFNTGLTSGVGAAGGVAAAEGIGTLSAGMGAGLGTGALSSLTQPGAPVVEASSAFNTLPTGTAVPAGGLTTEAMTAARITGGSLAAKVLSGTATAAEVAAAGAAAATAGKSVSDWAKALLPLAGAIAGGIGASSEPAGTTTTVQDIPDWLKTYVTGNLDAAQKYMTEHPQDNSLLAPATAQLKSTIAGNYLNSNPYIDAMFSKARDAVGSGIDSRFTAAGRYGSGAHQGVLGTTFNNLATDIYGTNYANERARQVAAAQIAPSFTTEAGSAPFSAFGSFGNLTKQGVSSTTSPYFNNPVGGALSGGLTGAMIAKLLEGYGTSKTV